MPPDANVYHSYQKKLYQLCDFVIRRDWMTWRVHGNFVATHTDYFSVSSENVANGRGKKRAI